MVSKLTAVLVGLLLVLGVGGSALAYEVEDPDASVSSTTVVPGGTVTFRAEGFAPGSRVTVTATRTDGEAAGSVDVVASGGGRLGTGVVVVQARSTTLAVTADAAGTVSTPVTLGAAGTWTMTATGTGADGEPLSVSASVLVSAGTPGSSGTTTSGAPGALARTGVDGLATTAWVGFGVLVLGGVLVAVASGRGRTDVTPDRQP